MRPGRAGVGEALSGFQPGQGIGDPSLVWSVARMVVVRKCMSASGTGITVALPGTDTVVEGCWVVARRRVVHCPGGVPGRGIHRRTPDVDEVPVVQWPTRYVPKLAAIAVPVRIVEVSFRPAVVVAIAVRVPGHVNTLARPCLVPSEHRQVPLARSRILNLPTGTAVDLAVR